MALKSYSEVGDAGSGADEVVSAHLSSRFQFWLSLGEREDRFQVHSRVNRNSNGHAGLCKNNSCLSI